MYDGVATNVDPLKTRQRIYIVEYEPGLGTLITASDPDMYDNAGDQYG